MVISISLYFKPLARDISSALLITHMTPIVCMQTRETKEENIMPQHPQSPNTSLFLWFKTKTLSH